MRLREKLIQLIVVGKRPDLSTTLYADSGTSRATLASLEETRRPEFETGKNPFGRAHDIRIIGFILLLLFLFMLLASFLISEYGYALPYGV